MGRVISGAICACLLSGGAGADPVEPPLPYLQNVRWGSAGLCGPETRPTGDAAPLYLDEYGLALQDEPVFCSFHVILGGALAADGVHVAHLVCSRDAEFTTLLTLALALTPESVADSTARLRLMTDTPDLSQDLYLCAE